MLKQFITKITSYRFTPIILLFLCILSYGLFIPFTGFFMDDIYLTWFKHFFGALQYPLYFSLDRPFQGYFFTFASYLLGGAENPIVWHIFAIIVRWLSTLALWKMLNTLWPKAVQQNSWVALLAAVFPGFTQHWMVIIYSYFYTCLAFFFLSITLMVKAIREPKRFWLYYPISLVLGFYSMTSEFYYGLELIRPIILWFEFAKLEDKKSHRMLAIIKYWIPYFISFLLFTIWRVFLFESVNHAMAITQLNFLSLFSWFGTIVQTIYQSIVNTVIYSWVNPFNLANYPQKGIIPFIILGSVLLVFIGISYWLLSLKKTSTPINKDDVRTWRYQALVLSAASLIVAGLPFIAAQLPVDSLGFNNRFSLAFIMGSCLLIAVLFESIFAWEKKGVIIISLLVAVALGYQISNANFYKNIWNQQKYFYWQVIWRFPELRPGTTIITASLPSHGELYSGEAVTSILNWTYQDKVSDRKIDYKFIILNSGQKNIITTFDKNLPIISDFRTYHFEGNTSNTLFLYYALPGCVRILDQEFSQAEGVIFDLEEQPFKDEILSAVSLSNLDLITSDGSSPNHPPLQILGEEPDHTWCFYFEKAEFYRQAGDYQKVVSLLGEAQAKGFSPLVETEWYPFIDSYARLGDWEKAEETTNLVASNFSATTNFGLCNVWKNIKTTVKGSETPEDVSNRILMFLDCK